MTINIKTTNIGLACTERTEKHDLDHVKVEGIGPDRVRLIATNGRTLAITMAQSDAASIDGWIPRSVLDHSEAQSQPKVVKVHVSKDTTEHIHDKSDGPRTIHPMREPKCFPPYREVIPDIRKAGGSFTVASLNALLLLDLALAIGRASDHPDMVVTLIIPTKPDQVRGVAANTVRCARGPITVLSKSNHEGLGVLMPVAMEAEDAYIHQDTALICLALNSPAAPESSIAEPTP